MRGRVVALVAALSLLVVALACGTPESATPQAAADQAAQPTETPRGASAPQGVLAAAETPTPTATPIATSVGKPPFPPSSSSASASAMTQYIMQVQSAMSGMQVTETRLLQLQAAGADDMAQAAEMKALLPSLRTALATLKAATPPAAMQTLHDAMLARIERSIIAVEQVAQGHDTGDVALVQRGMAAYKVVEIDGTAGTEDFETQMMSLLNGITGAAGTPRSMPAPVKEALEYSNTVLRITRQQSVTARRVCELEAAGADQAEINAARRDQLAAARAAHEQLKQLAPPAHLKPMHELNLELGAKLIAADELLIEGYERNNQEQIRQAKMQSAQAMIEFQDKIKSMMGGGGTVQFTRPTR